ncbi:LysR family transcriptional regulator [Vibrio sp. ZSDE26]|uniref:LysR family transcriptional regulator n=1 Tax=Vibrio amylolyticus TaxID=2847292 RepID=A0A9X1XL53_9VIBR|nr:LysR family transcriptional regulator [Vibrio amylolyticus]MCK6264446.1 LysR family transcriptional regulator [Vibrio amylolyticus]
MRNDELTALRELDFNLLKTLLVLLEQKHITKSAELLFITQPAVSKQLAKLREMFDDPLLVRVGNQLVLTQKAKSIHEKVAGLCEQFRDLIAPDTLNLAEVNQSVTIMLSDYGSPHWMTKIVKRVSQEAPNVTLTCKSWNQENINKLITGEINFALGTLPERHDDYESEQIGELPSSLIANKEHRLFSGEKVENLIENYPIVKIRGSHKHDATYSHLVKNNQVLLDEATLWLALETLKHTEAFLIGPSKFINEIDDSRYFQSRELPMLKLMPVVLSWSRGLTNDLFYCWMKDTIVDIGKGIMNEI